MEDNAQRVPIPAMQAAHTVTHVDAIAAPGASYGAVVDCEGDGVAVLQRNDVDPALHSRALFGEDEFAAGEILAGYGEQDRDLDRKDQPAVKILMQADRKSVV